MPTSKPPLDLDWLKALDLNFPADATELAIPSVDEAARLMRERRFDLYAVMAEVGASFVRQFGDVELPRLQRVQDALALSFARMASRHCRTNNRSLRAPVASSHLRQTESHK